MIVPGSPEYQRKIAEDKRKLEHQNLVKCLECDLSFVRVGSHVVQVHGYESAREYRQKYGLSRIETVLEDHRKQMSELNSTFDNIRDNKRTRFKAGGNHGERVSTFWEARKKNVDKIGYVSTRRKKKD